MKIMRSRRALAPPPPPPPLQCRLFPPLTDTQTESPRPHCELPVSPLTRPQCSAASMLFPEEHRAPDAAISGPGHPSRSLTAGHERPLIALTRHQSPMHHRLCPPSRLSLAFPRTGRNSSHPLHPCASARRLSNRGAPLLLSCP